MIKTPVNVIIPTLRSPQSLEWLVEQIKETAGVPVKVHPTGLRTSASVNRNMGLDLVRGSDAVAMVDDDVEFPWKDWLRAMVDVLARPEVVMVSAQLHDSNGKPAYMTGLQDWGGKPKWEGETVVPTKRLLTACCAFLPLGCRFDEGYVGSGFEDIDFCNQLAAAYPDGRFVVCHEARAVHRNEAKNQRGPFWEHNKRHYESKWGRLETPEEMLAKWRHKVS